MVPITFGKIYRRLDSSKRYLEGSSFNLNPTVELIDNDPQVDGDGKYVAKAVDIYVSNRNEMVPDNDPDNKMTLSDTIYSGFSTTTDNVVTNRINAIYKINSASTWIMFKKRNNSDDISGFTLDFFIKNSDTYNMMESNETNL